MISKPAHCMPTKLYLCGFYLTLRSYKKYLVTSLGLSMFLIMDQPRLYRINYGKASVLQWKKAAVQYYDLMAMNT